MPVFAPTIVEQRILRQLCPSSRNGILTAYAKFSILPQLIIGKTIEMPDRVAKCYCPNACTRICFANACPKLTWQPRKARSSEGPDSWLAWGRAVLVTVHVLYRHGQNRPKWPTSYSMLKGQGMGGGGAIPSGRRARQAAHDSYACAALAAGSPTQKSALGTVMWAVKGPAWDSSSARDAGVRAEKCISHARLSQAWAASRCQPLNGQRSTGASRRSGRGALPVGIKAGIAEVLSRQDCNGGGRQNTFTAQCSEEAVSCLIFVLMLLALRIDTNVFVTHVVADGLCCKTTRDHDFRWLRFVGLGAIHQLFSRAFLRQRRYRRSQSRSKRRATATGLLRRSQPRGGTCQRASACFREELAQLWPRTVAKIGCRGQLEKGSSEGSLCGDCEEAGPSRHPGGDRGRSQVRGDGGGAMPRQEAQELDCLSVEPAASRQSRCR